MKLFLSKILPSYFKTYLKKFRRFNSIHDLDKKLLKYINYNNGYFIECGAFNGIDQSNTWYYEKYKNWQGVLIEPNPTEFKKLQNNRNKNNYFFNLALTSCDKIKFLNLNQNKLTSKIEHQGLKVPANTLTNILIKAQSPALIDFFSLDVEGYEFNVLEGIDFKKFNFKYFLIETKDNKRLINYLENKNYKFLENLSHHDLLFEFITIK